MASYFITSPNGQRFKVNAPDDASQDQVLAYAKSQFKRMASQKASEAIQNARVSRELGGGMNPEDAPEPVGALPKVAGQIARMGAQAIAGFPLLAMDAGVGLRNLVEAHPPFPGMQPDKQGYELPSSQFKSALDSAIPAPSGFLEKANEILGSTLLGARLPAPQGEAVPSNYINARQAAKQQALAAGREQGLVTPPSTTNPSIGNRLLEGIGGKLKLQQEASIRNAPKFEQAQSRALGVNEDIPVTRDVLDQVRQEAFQSGYEPIRKVGQMRADDAYRAALANIPEAAKGADRSFPGLGKNDELDDVLKSINQDTFDSGDAIDAVRLLRDKADEAFRGGKNTLGRAFKNASKAVEQAIERNLQRMGKNGQEMLKNYRAARVRIAKSHTAEKVMGNEYGGVDARKLAGELRKGTPLQGEQRQMAEFAANFPKASQFISESYPAISPLDNQGSIIAAGAAGSPAPLLWPLTRVGARNYLLSNAGQGRALPQQFMPRDQLGVSGYLPVAGSNALLDLLAE